MTALNLGTGPKDNGVAGRLDLIQRTSITQPTAMAASNVAAR
jgi:hypothetical protein